MATGDANGGRGRDERVHRSAGTSADDAGRIGAAAAERLWAALHRARSGDTPITLAHTEDAVFRFYLPMARTLAHAAAADPADRGAAEQTAELGLAQAVLAWPQRTASGFSEFAKAAITVRLDALFTFEAASAH